MIATTATQVQTKAAPAAQPAQGSMLQRACACGQHTASGGECEECKKKRESLRQPPLSTLNESSGSNPPHPGAGTGALAGQSFFHVSDWMPAPSSSGRKMQGGSAFNIPLDRISSRVEQRAKSTMRRLEAPSLNPAKDPQAMQTRLGAGNPLEAGVKAKFEKAFGEDFSAVRLHTDGTAVSASSNLDAHAFTVGNHIAFGEGEYRPGTPIGDALIAHELVHVIQQKGSAGSVATYRNNGSSENAYEADANRSALAAVATMYGQEARLPTASEKSASPRLKSGLSLQRCGKSTTPDGVSIGPTDKTKIFSLKAGSFQETYGVDQNNASAATGRQDIKFEGENTGKKEGKDISCDCGLYRHWIGGYYRTGSATAAKGHTISSCGKDLTINESGLVEEYTTCIGDNDPDACKWAYADAPGFTGISEGDYVELQYSFGHQVWDRCQGKEVTKGSKILNIKGDKTPRTITWS
jgi:hypothetical protein